MFNPIQLKFKKEHKKSFKNKEYSLKNASLLFGTYGLVSKQKGVLRYKELEATKKILLKGVKGIGLVISRVRPIRPRTAKKKGMRMGKGKGEVSNWIVQIKAGTVLFEVFGLVEEKKIKEIFKVARHRLSLSTRNVFAPNSFPD